MATLRGRALGVIAAVLLSLAAVPAIAQCGPMDVVFVVDNTASMTDVIAQVQQQVTVIASAVVQQSGGDYQLGLVACPLNEVDVYADMAPKNFQAFEDGVAKMATSSSCDEPAATDAGLDTVINQLKAAGHSGPAGQQNGDFNGQFRANATKIVIIITDARPAGFNCSFLAGRDDVHAHQMAVDASQKGIHIASIFVPTVSAQDFGFIPDIIPIMQDYAVTSDGEYFQTQPDASDLANAIGTIITTCGTANGLSNSSLVLDPNEVFLQNGESTDVSVTNYSPAPDGETTTYAATGLPADSSITFSDRAPDVGLTEAKTMHIAIGPDTTAGTYIVPVTASRPEGVANNYVMVFVDCVPPFLYGTADLGTQSKTVTSGASTTLSVVPNGNGPFRYQWYQGHTGSTAFPIAGATSASLTTGPINAPSDFWVRITNACGTRDSATATVTPTP